MSVIMQDTLKETRLRPPPFVEPTRLPQRSEPPSLLMSSNNLPLEDDGEEEESSTDANETELEFFDASEGSITE